MTLVFLVVAASGCSDDTNPTGPAPPPTPNFRIQDGVHPDPAYNGTRDAILKDGPSVDLRNGNFGTVPLDTLGVVEHAGTRYERRLIVRMDMTVVPGCQEVLSARLKLTIGAGAGDTLTLEAFEAAVPSGYPGTWPEGSGGAGAGVSWQTVNGSESWTEPGGDHVWPSFHRTTVITDTLVTIVLPEYLVYRWIRDPVTNHGVIVRSTSTSRPAYRLVGLREAAEPTSRPLLELAYVKGG